MLASISVEGATMFFGIMMPNSLVTFNRFWLTYQNTAGLPDQPAILSQFFGSDTATRGVAASVLRV